MVPKRVAENSDIRNISFKVIVRGDGCGDEIIEIIQYNYYPVHSEEMRNHQKSPPIISFVVHERISVFFLVDFRSRGINSHYYV